MIKDTNKKYNQKIQSKNNLNKGDNTIVGCAYHVTPNAITLIALVITIIVLLILAGVTINLVLGPEGLLKQAQDATDRYKQAENEELNSMSNLLAQLEEINNGIGGGTENPPNPIDPDNPSIPDVPAGEVIKTENNIKYTADGEGNQIPVPVGFSYLEGTKETGVVIKNDRDLNEFVWIPTDLVEYKMDDDWSGSYSSKYREYYVSGVDNTGIINEITRSVDKHKGYYISRYEAGVKVKRTSRKETSQTDLPNPVFRATNSGAGKLYAYNFVTCDDAIYIGNNLYSKEKGDNVTSRLINSRGWDTALKFIETIGNDKDNVYPTDSTGKGWYNNNNSNNVNYEIGKSVDLTNATVPNKLKNIYDMAGNMKEWTASVSTDASNNRIIRRWKLAK